MASGLGAPEESMAVMTAPALARETEFGRQYINPRTAEVAPSVTNTLSVIRKPQVEDWKVRKAAQFAATNWVELGPLNPFEKVARIREAPDTYANEKADLGTAVHAVADNFMKGIPSALSKETDPYVRQFVKFLSERRPRFLFTECTLWCRSAEFAGTADAIAEINGEIWMLDIKTGKGTYPEHALQLSALAHCEFIINPDGSEIPVPGIDRWASSISGRGAASWCLFTRAKPVLRRSWPPGGS